MVIDVHAHYYPQRYLEYIGRTELAAPTTAALAHQTIGERLDLLDRAGIDTQVLSPSQAQPYLPDARRASEAATMLNDLYAELCEQHARRFLAFAALPLPHIGESLDEIARITNITCVVGVAVGCSVAGRQLDDPIFDPVYEELDRVGAVVFLHPVGQADTPWLAGRNLAWLVGAPFEDTVAALRLVLAEVPARYPNIRFIVPHLGGRITRKNGEGIARGLASLYYDTVSGSVDAVTSARHAFGPDRLLFGTDYPYCDDREFVRHLDYLDECGFDGPSLEAVRGATAARLFSEG